ncbi:MAG: hypothetical protein AB7H96_09955 [Vicinamibacterales bacterium]
MKIVRIALASLLTIGLSGIPAFAGELRDSVAKAAETEAAKSEAQETAMKGGGSGKALVWGGSALFVGGMTYGLFKFINNENGSYSEFGEYGATSARGGALGLGMAFAGGALMLLGKHTGGSMPSLSFGKKAVGLTKKVSW